MTFYNIIFGILFMGAFHEILQSLGNGPDWARFFQAGTLAILIFSDTIFTSIVIEGGIGKYTVRMKILDLLSFILLSCAAVILDPGNTNLYQVNVEPLLTSLSVNEKPRREVCFWILLTIYALVLIGWNHLAGVYTPKDASGKSVPLGGRWHWVQRALCGGLAVMAACSAIPNIEFRNLVLRGIIFTGSAAYLLVFKTCLIKTLKKELY